jgi:hypothetical protein
LVAVVLFDFGVCSPLKDWQPRQDQRDQADVSDYDKVSIRDSTGCAI